MTNPNPPPQLDHHRWAPTITHQLDTTHTTTQPPGTNPQRWLHTLIDTTHQRTDWHTLTITHHGPGHTATLTPKPHPSR